MNYYFAPLEGLTDRIYRRLHHQYFSGVDRYYMPFLSPTVHRGLTNREILELPPADTVSFLAIPQILTKVPEDFLWLARQCRDLGYQEVNLNLGCPSGTVVAKGKGSGMLAAPDTLARFLDAVYSEAPLPISVKTRIGFEDPQEFPQLLDLYNQYPIVELTVHPRVRKAFYRGDIQADIFDYCVKNSKNPVCFNGNLCSLRQIQEFSHRFPSVNSVMLGRGLIGDPGMLTPGGTTIDKLACFYAELLDCYTREFGGPRNAMFRLKENWRYLLCLFENSEKLGKRLRKTTDLQEFRSITTEIFHTLPLRSALQPDW